MKKRCCIIGAAEINNYSRIKSYLSDDDFFIFCDAGLNHRKSLCKNPDLIIGDFDSYPQEDFSEETIILPHVKDDTDTYFAAKEALNRGFDDFIIIGCIGNRLDHTLANLGLLLFLSKNNSKALLIDDYSEMEIVSNKPAYISSNYPYFSLVPIDGDAFGIHIEDALYPLTDHSFTASIPLGISNEPLPNKTAKVWLEKGSLLLIRIFDR